MYCKNVTCLLEIKKKKKVWRVLLYMLRNCKIEKYTSQDSLHVFTRFQSSGFVFLYLQLIKPVLEHINWAACPYLVIWLSTVFLAWLLGSSVFYFYSIPARIENPFWLLFSLTFVRLTFDFLTWFSKNKWSHVSSFFLHSKKPNLFPLHSETAHGFDSFMTKYHSLVKVSTASQQQLFNF